MSDPEDRNEAPRDPETEFSHPTPETSVEEHPQSSDGDGVAETTSTPDERGEAVEEATVEAAVAEATGDASWQDWFERFRRAAAPDERAYAVRIATAEWQQPLPLEISGADDLLTTKGGFQPSQVAQDHALAFFRGLGPRAFLSDQAAGENRVAAGLVLAELVSRGLVDRVLVVCSSGTLVNWREELHTRWAITPFSPTSSTKEWSDTRGCWLVTWEQAAEHATELAKFGPQLVVVDDAQRVAECDGEHPLVAAIGQADPIWRVLLSAQPLQQGIGDLHAALSLLHTPQPNPLGSDEDFRTEFLEAKNGRFLKKSKRDPFREVLGRHMRRTTREEAVTEGGAAAREIRDQPVEPVDREVAYRDRALSAIHELAEEQRPAYARSLMSSPWAFAYDVEQAFARKEEFAPDLKAELQRLVLDGRKFRVTGKSQALAKLVKKTTSMWKKSKSRVVVYTHHPQTLHELEKQLVSQGLGKQVAVLRAGQTASNRIALRGFQADPPSTPVLLATDDAVAGMDFPVADTLVNYDLPWNPVLLEQRIARVDCAAQEADTVVVHNLFLEDTSEQDILVRLYDKLGLFECQAGETIELLQACGFPDGSAYEAKLGQVFMLAAEHGNYEKPLLEVLKSRKSAEKEIRDRRRAAEMALGGMDGLPDAQELGEPLPRPNPRVALDTLMNALLEHRGEGWERDAEGHVLLHTASGTRELVPAPRAVRLLRGQGDAPKKWVFAPGSNAWAELAGRFLDGCAYYLHDARELPLDPVKAVLQRRFQEHGMVVDAVRVLDRTPAIAGQVSFRLRAEAGGERVERLFETEFADKEHHLDGAYRDLKNLPCNDTDGIKTLDADQFEEFVPVLESASREAAEAVASDPLCSRFVERQHSLGHQDVSTSAAPLGFKGVVYDVARVEFTVRHKEQSTAWTLQADCVPLTGTLLGDLPLPEPGSEPAEMWACTAGHLVRKDQICSCATEGCEVGACEEHLAEAGTSLQACSECGELGCSDHAFRCSGCGNGLCGTHTVALAGAEGGHGCTACTVTLDDGRTFLGGEVETSDVSGRKGLRVDLVKTESGRWAFPDEIVICPVSGRTLLADETAVDEISGERVAADQLERSEVSGAYARKDRMVVSAWSGRKCLDDEAVTCELTGETLLPDELETCARSGKKVRKDKLFTDPVSGERCLEEFTVESAVSGTRTLPENLEKCARSGKPALVEELRECTQCRARILPDEGITCSESGQFACPDHLVACEATGDRVLPSALGRCEVSGRTVKTSLLETCPETGRNAHKDLFVECEATGHRVLRDALALCSVSGKRVQRGLLEACSVTGRQALGDELATCQITGKRVMPDLLMECPESGLRFLASHAVKCEESGALCAPDGISECTETGRKVRSSLLATDDFTGQRVLARLLKACKRTGKQTAAANLGVCTVSGLRVIESELVECAESERPVLPDHLAVCEETGRKVHPDQLVTCHETKRQILRRVAERCAVTGHPAAPGVLVECAETGKKVLPSQVAIDGITGERVLTDLMVECEYANCRTLARNLVRSAVSGREIPRRDAAQCDISGAWALPEELETCAVTGKRALPELMSECEATGDRVLKEQLTVCESSGKRVRADRIAECPRTGQKVLAEHLVPSQMSGEIGLRTLLVPCEFSRKRVFPDELMVSELSGKSFRKDRLTTCTATGRSVDSSEVQDCACCHMPTGKDLVEDDVCPTCMNLIGHQQGHVLGEADAAKVTSTHSWAKKVSALETTGALHVLVPKSGLKRRKHLTLLVFKRDAESLQLMQEVPLEHDIVDAFREAAKQQAAAGETEGGKRGKK
jgi:hypothetical protein